MKILTVCSGLDFVNYTRRATIEAIHKLNPQMDILLFNSVLNFRRKKNITPDITFFYYHFWTLEKLRKFKIFSLLEYSVRYIKWKTYFKTYDAIFLIDPNQFYLLPYVSKEIKIIYLLRDPSVLLDSNNYNKEFAIIRRADLILAVSQNLCKYYFEKYYGFVPKNVKLWPNTVDLNLWDYSKWRKFIVSKSRPLIGLAGNIDFVIDIDLLIYIAEHLPDYDFEIAGKLDLNSEETKLWKKLLTLPNIRFLGFINYDDFPSIVINWDVGLVAAKPDHEYALYLNNNKQYQYLALGKPFVTFHLNANYKEFEDMVFIAETRSDYILKIKLALEKSKELGTIEQGGKIAYSQSANARALTFMNYLTKMYN